MRRPDGSHVAFDANPLHEWAKAAGSIYQAELQRLLSLRLGLEWGPERNGCREVVGFTPSQLRAFSKRSVAIEAELEASGAVYVTPERRCWPRRPGAPAGLGGGALPVNVTNSIKQVLGRHVPALALPLRSTVRRGRFCVYEPDPDRATCWDLG